MSCGNIFGFNFTKHNNSEDRVFKYKAVNCPSVPIVVCEELLSQDSLLQLFKLMDELFLKIFNIRVEYIPIPYEELIINGTSIQSIQNVSGVLFPVELSGVEKDDFWHYSPVFLTSELTLMTGPPTEVGKYSMAFLTMDNSVTCLLLLCIFILPLLAKLSEFVTDTGLVRRRQKTSTLRIVRNYCNMSWNFFSIFFFEPFELVPKIISLRIIIGLWLIAISILSTFMGSELKTELYSTEHVLIESLESFSKYTNAKIRFSPNGNGAGFFEEWETSTMDIQPKFSLAKRVQNMEVVELLDGDTYQDVFLGKAGIFIPKLYLDNMLSILLESDADFRKFNFYFNEERIKNLIFVFPVSTEFKRCPEFIEQISLGMGLVTETKFMDYSFFKTNFYISRVVWKKPTKSLSALTINETYGAFLLFIYGLGIATATFISEVIFELTSNFNKTSF